MICADYLHDIISSGKGEIRIGYQHIAYLCFSVQGVCFPPTDPLIPPMVPLAQTMLQYDYCVRFVERLSSRFLDVYCISDVGEYDELWTEAETSYYETCQSSEDD